MLLIAFRAREHNFSWWRMQIRDIAVLISGLGREGLRIMARIHAVVRDENHHRSDRRDPLALVEEYADT